MHFSDAVFDCSMKFLGQSLASVQVTLLHLVSESLLDVSPLPCFMFSCFSCIESFSGYWYEESQVAATSSKLSVLLQQCVQNFFFPCLLCFSGRALIRSSSHICCVLCLEVVKVPSPPVPSFLHSCV